MSTIHSKCSLNGSRHSAVVTASHLCSKAVGSFIKLSFGLWALEHFGGARGVQCWPNLVLCHHKIVVRLDNCWKVYTSAVKGHPLQAMRMLSLSKLVTLSAGTVLSSQHLLWSPHSMSPAAVSIGLSTSKRTEGPSPKCSHLLPTLNEHFGGLDNYYNCNVLKSSFKSSSLIHVDRNLPGKHSVYIFCMACVLEDSQTCWKVVCTTLPPTPFSSIHTGAWQSIQRACANLYQVTGSNRASVFWSGKWRCWIRWFLKAF